MKTIVITGGTKGIGFGLAESFLKQGCQVVISGRDQHRVDHAVQRLARQANSACIKGIVSDVRRYQDLQALWNACKSSFGKVDVWINNAGMSINRRALWEQSPEQLSEIVETNLSGLMLANKVAAEGMLAQGHGQIWNMEGFGSNGSVQKGMAAYGATKRAVNYLNKALKVELSDTSVQVCTLSPGIVVTDLLVGDYDFGSVQWEKAKRIFNILGDTVDTVAPWLAEKILASNKSGAKVVWLTPGKAFRRFLFAAFNKRDLFTHLNQAS